MVSPFPLMNTPHPRQLSPIYTSHWQQQFCCALEMSYFKSISTWYGHLTSKVSEFIEFRGMLHRTQGTMLKTKASNFSQT